MAWGARARHNYAMKTFALSVVCILAACSKPAQTPAVPAESAAVSAASSVASSSEVSAIAAISFAGRWTGPEGTWLDIQPKGEGYRVTVSNLDGLRTFDGEADDGGIRFARDGRTFLIRPGNGGDTGMKWLAGKKDCLVVAPGEGYCRG